jgi:hypothetical protein
MRGSGVGGRRHTPVAKRVTRTYYADHPIAEQRNLPQLWARRRIHYSGFEVDSAVP